MKLFRIALLLMVAVFLAAAADVNGKWTAQVPGRDGQTREVTFNFKADGDKLTGTMSSPRGDVEIQDGKISGDDLSFAMAFREMKMVYKGKVSGNEIKFTREIGDRTQEFTAKRAQ